VEALWANVTSLLEISYGKMAGLRAGWRGGGKKSHIFYPMFFSITEKRLEERILGYQQVIHNAKIPTVAIVQVVATPT
jgi:hypothetical protein